MPNASVNSSREPSKTGANVRTLGQFVVEVNGERLKFGSKTQRKPLELLKVLVALGCESVPVEQISESLWPDSDGDRAQSAFRTTLGRLRKLIGTATLVLQDGRLTLEGLYCDVDARQFHEHVTSASEALEAGDIHRAWNWQKQAIELYRGPFLDGEFEPPEILSARTRLHGLFLRNVVKLGQALIEHREIPSAVDMFKRGLEVDDLAEELYQSLMQIYLQQGRLVEGIALFQLCRQLFQAKFGIDPSPATDAIHRELVAEQEKMPAPRDREFTITNDHLSSGGAPPVSSGSGNPSGSTGPAGALHAADSRGGIKYPDNHAASVGTPQNPPQHQETIWGMELPSIAVLPFVNMTDDPEQQYFCDGISEDIITDLAKISRLIVIGRQSSFAYHDPEMDVRQIGSELGVRYLLKGTVRKSGGTVRVNVQMVESTTGIQVWAERYDRNLKNAFQVGDEICEEITTSLNVKLVAGEQARIYQKALKSLKARDHFNRGVDMFFGLDENNRFSVRECFEKVVELEPEQASSYGWIGIAHCYDLIHGWSSDPERSLSEAESYAQRGLEKDMHCTECYEALGLALLFRGNHDQALVACERAIMERSVCPGPKSTMAYIQLYSGIYREAIENARNAIRLSPVFPTWYLYQIALGHYLRGEISESETTIREVMRVQPNLPAANLLLVCLLMARGNDAEARLQAQKILKIAPYLTTTTFAATQPYRDVHRRDHVLEVLHAAGIPA